MRKCLGCWYLKTEVRVVNLVDFYGRFCKNEWKKSPQYGMLKTERNVPVQPERSWFYFILLQIVYWKI